jgi:hypothetical protein
MLHPYHYIHQHQRPLQLQQFWQQQKQQQEQLAASLAAPLNPSLQVKPHQDKQHQK